MDLLQRFSQGDMDAFEALFQLHQREVYQWTICMVRDPAAAEDLTLETFWRIYRAHARFDPNRSFPAWARRIATNLALDYLRRSPREVGTAPAELDGRPHPVEADQVERREARGAIRRAFASLPAKLRAVAALALIEEEPYSEIAAALGVSLQAVKSREFRAVRLLRKKLLEMGIKP